MERLDQESHSGISKSYRFFLKIKIFTSALGKRELSEDETSYGPTPVKSVISKLFEK